MNHLDLAETIEKRYRSYLSTFFHIKDENLRSSFEEALEAGQLSKGPFVQGTPVFKRGQRLADIYSELFGQNLDDKLANALTAGRQLYLHQEKAIRSFAANRNVVVSTGTGSGKTESFLIPIVLKLYQEHLQGALGPGVKALSSIR